MDKIGIEQKGEKNMGLLDKFTKKNTESNKEPDMESKEEGQLPQEERFVYGVEDVFKLRDSDDLVVVGYVRGTVKPGMAVYVSNVGDDENETLLTTVQGLEIQGKPVDSATNCPVALRLQAGQKSNLKIGSVVFTRDMSTKEVHDAYINAIGNAYVGMRKLELSEKETEAMSIADMIEAWRLFVWKHSQTLNTDEDAVKEANRNKVAKLADALVGKILNAEEIYVVFNKRTGEPHMFSKTIDQKDGRYMCTPPDILVIPKAYAQVYQTIYSKDDYELKKIENGKDKKGIYNFLGSAFYLNGACGVDVIGPQTAIGATKLVAPPDYSNTPQINIPVTNPDLVRWMLLMGQLGAPDSPDKEIIFKLYHNFFSKELGKATLLIPIKKEGEIPTPDKNGKTVLNKDVQIQFPTMKGKHERDAVRMYTDWKRLRMVFNEEWSGMLQPVSGMIEKFDCVINVTEYPEAGCYIDKRMFEIATNRKE